MRTDESSCHCLRSWLFLFQHSQLVMCCDACRDVVLSVVSALVLLLHCVYLLPGMDTMDFSLVSKSYLLTRSFITHWNVLWMAEAHLNKRPGTPGHLLYMHARA